MCQPSKIEFSDFFFVACQLVTYPRLSRQPVFQDNQWSFENMALLFPSLPISLFDLLLPPPLFRDDSGSDLSFFVIFESLVRFACLDSEKLTLAYFCQVLGGDPKCFSILEENERLLFFDSRFRVCILFFLVCKVYFDYCSQCGGDYLAQYRALLTLFAWFPGQRDFFIWLCWFTIAGVWFS